MFLPNMRSKSKVRNCFLSMVVSFYSGNTRCVSALLDMGDSSRLYYLLDVDKTRFLEFDSL